MPMVVPPWALLMVVALVGFLAMTARLGQEMQAGDAGATSAG